MFALPIRRVTSTSVAALLAVAAALSLSAREWTRFRGPNGTGLSDDASVPAAWEEADFDWRVEIPGRGHSQPVFWDARLFVTSATGEGRGRVVLGLDAASGRTLWTRTFEMTTHGKHNLNSFASSTPAAEDGRLYVSFGSPEHYLVRALDHDGEVQWIRDLGPFVGKHALGVSPIIFEDSLIVQKDQEGESSLFALDKKTGDVRWKTDRRMSKTAFSTPCVYAPAGGAPQLIFNSQSHGISGVDPRSGEILWEAPLFSMRTVSSPVIADDLVIGTCGSGGGGNYVVAVRLGGSGDVSETHLAYKITRSAPYVPTPLVQGDRLYLWGDRGVVSCHRASSGEEVWRRRVGGEYFGSPILVSGRIYNASADGEVVVLAAADEFRELARNPIVEGTHATMAVHRGRIYIRTFTHLIAVGGKPDGAPAAGAGE